MADITLARKKELEEQDPFLEFINNGLELFKKYKVQIIAGLISFLVVWFSVVYYIDFTKTQEANGFEALQQVSASLSKIEKKDAKKTFETAQTGYNKVINDFGGTVAGKMAMVQLGDLCFKDKKYDKAIELYKKALDGFSGTSLENLVLSSLAITYEQKKDFKNAEINFQTIIAGESSYKKDEAYFHLGLLYENQEKAKDSKDMFGKIEKTSVYYKFIQEKL